MADKRPNFWPNFSLILSDNGRALLSDCGLLDEKFLDDALEGMRQHFGLKAIDAIVVSRYWFDPFWVRAEPYRATLNPGNAMNVTLHVRNFRSGRQRHRIEIHTPPGLRADPEVLEGTLAAESRQSFPIRLQASADAGPGVRLVAFDVTLDGRRYGERFDMIVNVNPEINVHRSKP